MIHIGISRTIHAEYDFRLSENDKRVGETLKLVQEKTVPYAHAPKRERHEILIPDRDTLDKLIESLIDIRKREFKDRE